MTPVTHVFVCVHLCVNVCECACGVKRSESPDTKVLAGPHSFFHSLPFFCGLVLFGGFCDEKKLYICLLHIMYVSEVQNI